MKRPHILFCFFVLLLTTVITYCKKEQTDIIVPATPVATSFTGTWGLKGISYLHFDTATGKQWTEYDTTVIEKAVTFINDTADNGFKFPYGTIYLNDKYLSKLFPGRGRWYFQDQLNNLYFSCSSGCSDTALNQKLWLISFYARYRQGYYYSETERYPDNYYSMTIENTGPLGADRTLVSTIISLWHKP